MSVMILCDTLVGILDCEFEIYMLVWLDESVVLLGETPLKLAAAAATRMFPRLNIAMITSPCAMFEWIGESLQGRSLPLLERAMSSTLIRLSCEMSS